ncbi:MAG: leucine-rich repeat protein [Acutalibacteraceae bacterium]|nr:leucine-rich repeat protein [Acutalibacteraceae bacterium]
MRNRKGAQVSYICDDAFYDCNKLTALETENNLKNIGSYAFVNFES